MRTVKNQRKDFFLDDSQIDYSYGTQQDDLKKNKSIKIDIIQDGTCYVVLHDNKKLLKLNLELIDI